VQEAAEEELSMLPPGMQKKFNLLDQLKEDEPRIQQIIEEIRQKNEILYSLPGPLPIDETDARRKSLEGEVPHPALHTVNSVSAHRGFVLQRSFAGPWSIDGDARESNFHRHAQTRSYSMRMKNGDFL